MLNTVFVLSLLVFVSGCTGIAQTEVASQTELYQKSCDGNNTAGCGLLGRLNERGQGVRQSR